MRPRAIIDLVQLPDREFFEQVSQGMSAVLANAGALVADAKSLADAQRSRSSALLLAVADEESAKFHILLDAVRCPRQGGALSHHLRRFNDHLAKGIYAEYAHTSPASFGEVLAFLERERKELFLDGPNDVDWIFRNRVLQDREESFYVDYVETDEGHEWLQPRQRAVTDGWFLQPAAYRLARRLSEAGLSHPSALAVIADHWRDVAFTPESHWMECHQRNMETLEALHASGLLTSFGVENAGPIAWNWLFPLWQADLSLIKVPRSDLREIQRSWYPDPL